MIEANAVIWRTALAMLITILGAFLLSALSNSEYAFAQQAEPPDQICCVSFYGEPVGLMSRQACQADGGDVAPVPRCEALTSASEEVVADRAPMSQAGISMEEEDDQPTSVVMPGTPAAPKLSISDASTDAPQVCCVSFYGQPVGLMSRKKCQADGGDVAAMGRCADLASTGGE